MNNLSHINEEFAKQTSDEICDKIYDNINKEQNNDETAIAELYYIKIRNKEFGKDHCLYMFAGVLDKLQNSFLADPNVCYDTNKLGDTFPDIDLTGTAEDSVYTPKQMYDIFKVIVHHRIHKYIIDKSGENTLSVQINNM